MELKPKRIKIKAGGTRYVAVLHEDTAQKLDLFLGDRVKLTSGRTTITATIDTTANGWSKNTIGLFWETYEDLNIAKGDSVHISPADKPVSVELIKKKLNGNRLNAEELDIIIKDVVDDNLTDVEMTYFVSGCLINGLSDRETADLTKSIVRNGSHLQFPGKIVADKHSIGGVPGNRITPVIVPIVAAAGILMPKTSSRAITSPAGTADSLETMTNVALSAPKLMKIMKTVGAFMIWGGGVDLAPADDHMIRVRKTMKVDPEGMMLASIMAKKHSVGSTHVVIDIPIGPQVKMKDQREANHLAKRFKTIAKMLGMKLVVNFSDGNQPVGRGIGPTLEMEDVMAVLQNKPDAPQDLREKSVKMSGMLFELTGHAKKGKGYKKAEEILNSGKAWKKFNQIIDAQGRRKFPKPAKYQVPVKAAKEGKVRHIDNKRVASVARVVGAPKAKNAGVFVVAKLGDKVKKGDTLFVIHAQNPDRVAYAQKFCKENNGYTISD